MAGSEANTFVTQQGSELFSSYETWHAYGEEFGGYVVRKGQNVILASTASHYFPELFAHPYTFDITHYDGSRKEHKQRGAYALFGIGTHTCLGAGAAEAQIVLVMAALLHIVRPEWTQPRKKLVIKKDPTPTPGNAFRVRLMKQHDE